MNGTPKKKALVPPTSSQPTRRITLALGSSKSKAIKLKKQPKTEFISQTAAKGTMLPLCRRVLADATVICIKDSSNKPFIVLTCREKEGAFVTVSAQFFKDNFARCCSLVRSGVIFQLTIRGSDRTLYARRHSSYRDPLDEVIKRWHEKLVEVAINDENRSQTSKLAQDFASFMQRIDMQVGEDREERREEHQKLVRGLARMAIGHRPFDEGQMPGDRDPDPH